MSPIPGWYTDPSAPGQERWWDGETWTAVTRFPSTLADGSFSAPNWGLAPVDGSAPSAAPHLRLSARIVDALLTGFLASLAGGRLLEPANAELKSIQRQFSQGIASPQYDLRVLITSAAAFLAVTLLIRGGYFVVLTATKGATPGKLLSGVRVVQADGGEPPTWGQAFNRWAARDIWRVIALIPFVGILGVAYWVVDSWWCLRDPRGQTLHDKAARTRVIPRG